MANGRWRDALVSLAYRWRRAVWIRTASRLWEAGVGSPTELLGPLVRLGWDRGCALEGLAVAP